MSAKKGEGGKGGETTLKGGERGKQHLYIATSHMSLFQNSYHCKTYERRGFTPKKGPVPSVQDLGSPRNPSKQGRHGRF